MDVGRWGQGETHTTTALCSSDGTRVGLQLLVDGKDVLRASDTTSKGPFRAGILVMGPVDLDLQHFTVTTL